MISLRRTLLQAFVACAALSCGATVATVQDSGRESDALVDGAFAADASTLDAEEASADVTSSFTCTGMPICDEVGHPCPCTWGEVQSLPGCPNILTSDCSQEHLNALTTAFRNCYYSTATGQLIVEEFEPPMGGGSCAGPSTFPSELPLHCVAMTVACRSDSGAPEAGSVDAASE